MLLIIITSTLTNYSHPTQAWALTIKFLQQGTVNLNLIGRGVNLQYLLLKSVI